MTLDVGWLGSWIQPQHLEENALRAYCETFTSHPARLIQVTSFLLDDIARKISRFLTNEATFRNTYGLFSSKIEVAEEEWHKAKEKDRFYKYSLVDEIPQELRLSPNLIMYLKLRADLALNQARFM